jgi:hypothetical protein
MTWYTDVIQKDARFHAGYAVRDTGLLFPPFLTKIQSVVADATKHGQTFEIIETYRSEERQEELFAAHATQLKTVGVHHYGLACDLLRIIGGRAHWESSAYALLGTLGEAEGLTWGGRWSFGDFVHLQYIPVADQKKLFDLSWYPT